MNVKEEDVGGAKEDVQGSPKAIKDARRSSQEQEDQGQVETTPEPSVGKARRIPTRQPGKQRSILFYNHISVATSIPEADRCQSDPPPSLMTRRPPPPPVSFF